MVNLFKILNSSKVDGPGDRVVVYFQGCDILCPACMSKHTWDARTPFSTRVDEYELAKHVTEMAKNSDGITISGGDPFFQSGPLAFFVRALRKYGAKHIIVFTGNDFEDLINPVNPKYIWVKEILPMIDILVDGQFIPSLDNPFMNYRGSSNQRVIDVPATLKNEELTLIDWDSLEIAITPEGEIYLPVGLSRIFAEYGQAEPTKKCGQSKF